MNKDFNVYKWRREYLNEIKYQTYQDYKREKSKWGSPEDLKEDITNVINRLISRSGVSITNVEDQSDDVKGIKFEVTLNTGDTIHAFKVEGWRGKWELYLNRKKVTGYEISNYFESKLSSYEQWKLAYDRFDSNYMYSDAPGSSEAGSRAENRLRDMYDALSSTDKEKAIEYNSIKKKLVLK
jgi:hypothetical protein